MDTSNERLKPVVLKLAISLASTCRAKRISVMAAEELKARRSMSIL
jgi:hypothetical protein